MRSSGGARRVTIRSTSGGRSPPSDVCSSTSTGYLFLNAVLPEMGVISCGAGNKYGHPHEETLSILRDAGVDMMDPKPVNDALALFGELLDEMEGLMEE